MEQQTIKNQRDRPAPINPGGMVCEKCGTIFIGEEWHLHCAACHEKGDQ